MKKFVFFWGGEYSAIGKTAIISLPFLRKETQSYRDCFQLAIHSNSLLGQTKQDFFYNIETTLKIGRSTSDNGQRLENFHNTPTNPGVYGKKFGTSSAAMYPKVF